MDKDINRIKVVLAEKGGAARLLSVSWRDTKEPNYALCQGMVNFNMIDTIGRGIRKVFTEQQKRFFPMPDYQIDQAKKEVTVKIYGKLINEQYYRLLKANPDLSLYDCIALDMVQKHEKIDKDIASRLRKLPGAPGFFRGNPHSPCMTA